VEVRRCDLAPLVRCEVGETGSRKVGVDVVVGEQACDDSVVALAGESDRREILGTFEDALSNGRPPVRNALPETRPSLTVVRHRAQGGTRQGVRTGELRPVTRTVDRCRRTVGPFEP